jgi:hypothetical protein
MRLRKPPRLLLADRRDELRNEESVSRSQPARANHGTGRIRVLSDLNKRRSANCDFARSSRPVGHQIRRAPAWSLDLFICSEFANAVQQNPL